MEKIKIEKLDINLFPKNIEEEYKKAKYKFISEREVYNYGGFFSSGYYEKRPDLGEAEWNKMYPNGLKDWANNWKKLTSTGQQQVINKINELVEIINNLIENK